MKVYRLDEMKKGWFIGPFDPSILKTSDFECAVKKYKAGEKEVAHVHRVAIEYTVIVSGSVRMNSTKYSEGSIIAILPGEATDFEALTDVTTVVIKVPGVIGDKYAAV